MPIYYRNAAIPWSFGDVPVEEEVVTTAPPAAAEVPIARESEEEMTSETWMFPVTIAQQIYSMVPGIFGGLAAWILASKLTKAKEVKATEVLLASGLVAAVTFGSIFLIRTVREYDEE